MERTAYLGVGHAGIAAAGGGGAEPGVGAAGCTDVAGFNRATTRGFFGTGFFATGGGGGVGCSSTKIGFGVKCAEGALNSSARTSLDRSTWTGTVCGMYPLSATVIVPSFMGKPRVQGVRQAAPTDVRASAPGGSDSIRTGSVAGAGFNADMSKLGTHDEQADTNRPHAAMAMTRRIIASVPMSAR
jgi:hypothetical protein